MKTSVKLGKMKKVEDLRTVWKSEPRNFSKWLAEEENLNMLGTAIGIDITLEQLESKVGDFSVDLLAVETGSSRKIIIENQLEDTNHDHLGKIITYASGKGAQIIIWVVKHAREEHRKAVEWLNEKTPSDIAFFLVEIELWQIDDSAMAPHFNVVERPNEWARSIQVIEGLSETKKLQFEFWQKFCEYAFANEEMAKEFTRRKPGPQHWHTFGISGKPYTINAAVNTTKKLISVDLYIAGDKDFYHSLLEQREAFESDYGAKLEWNEAEKDCRIVAKTKGDIKDTTESYWNGLFDWLIASAIKLKEVTLKYDK